MEYSLKSLLNQKDWVGVLKSLKNGFSFSEEEEFYFFKETSKKWQKAYIEIECLFPKTERWLMATASLDLLKKSYEKWGFFEKNLEWVFSQTSETVCQKILSVITNIPGDEVEKAMLQRQDTELLILWLKKFKELSEEAERLLEEKAEYQSLKRVYIDFMVEKLKAKKTRGLFL